MSTPAFIRPDGDDLIRDGAAAITQNADAASALRWDKTATALTSGSDISSPAPGVYAAYPSAVAVALNLPTGTTGVLTHTNIPGGAATQTYHPITANNLYVRTRSSSGSWSAWKAVGYTRPDFTGDADTLTTPGVYPMASSQVTNTPGDVGTGTVIVYRVTASLASGHAIQMFINGRTTSPTLRPDVWVRRQQSGGWTTWLRLAWADDVTALEGRVSTLEAATGGGGGLAGLRIGEHDMRVEELRHRIGTVSAEGKAVVALVCDHGSLNFQDIVLPKLRQHGMKATLAMCSTQLALEPTNEVASWATVASWASEGVEIACHSKTHQDVTGDSALFAEIIQSRDELSANLGGLPIDTWVQAGPRNLLDPGKWGWDGFYNPAGAHNYLSTAGELIWNGYASYTGSTNRPGVAASRRVFPLTGEPPLGPARRFIDGGTANITSAQDTVNWAIANGGRCIVAMHPAYIRTDGRTDMVTKTQAEAFIDWLAARSSAGEIMLVQMREWALAEE